VLRVFPDGGVLNGLELTPLRSRSEMQPVISRVKTNVNINIFIIFMIISPYLLKNKKAVHLGTAFIYIFFKKLELK